MNWAGLIIILWFAFEMGHAVAKHKKVVKAHLFNAWNSFIAYIIFIVLMYFAGVFN